jgi:hypothetical protein
MAVSKPRTGRKTADQVAAEDHGSTGHGRDAGGGDVPHAADCDGAGTLVARGECGGVSADAEEREGSDLCGGIPGIGASECTMEGDYFSWRTGTSR